MIALLCTIAQGISAQNAVTSVSTKGELTGAIANGANIQLTADIQLDSYLNINGITVTIDLNGHRLYRNLSSSSDSGHIFWVHANDNNVGGKLTIEDSSTAKTGTIEGGYAPNGGGINVWPGCSLTVSDVTFKNNRAGNMGGAIFVREDATVTINKVTFTGNSAGDHGGAIWNRGTVTAENCKFENNTANDVGALYNAVLTEGNVTYAGTATLTDCTFEGNKGTTGAGALANAVGDTEMTIVDCTIQNNISGSRGAGIWNGGTLNMEGAVTVKDNTDVGGVVSNVFLKDGTLITVTGSLAGSSIGVEMEESTGMFTGGTFTRGFSSYNSGVDTKTIFTADRSSIAAVESDGGEARLITYKSNPLSYIERKWENNKVVSTEKGLSRLIPYATTPEEGDYKEVTNAPTEEPNQWLAIGNSNSTVAEYYVVSRDVTRKTIVVQGSDVHLILCDGVTLTLTGGLKLEGDNKLYIHSQSYGGSMGRLIVTNSYDDAAGIGSAQHDGNEMVVGELVIHGGYIVATGGTRGAGIGSCTRKSNGRSELCKSVTIYGGFVRATGGIGGAGIGSGSMENNGDYNDNCTAGTVRIYDGTVIATGGDEGGAGIGGGRLGRGASVFVYGGTVTATGGEETEIDSDVETTTVYPAGYGGAGIGGGTLGRGGEVTITGGTVIAKAAARDPEKNRAIGSGYANGNNGSLVIGDEMMVEAGNYSSVKSIYTTPQRVTACSSCPYAEISPCTHSSGLTYTINEGGTHTSHCEYCAVMETAGHSIGICVCGYDDSGSLAISLADGSDNSEKLNAYNGRTAASVTLTGRTLWKDGNWNTLCLPFDVDDIANSPLANYSGLMTLDVTSTEDDGVTKKTRLDGTTLNLWFANAMSIKAGKPYIIKWEGNGTNNLTETDLVFSNVTISNALTEVESADGTVTFVGTYSPMTYTETTPSILFLGSNNKLYFPQPSAGSTPTIGAQRAYFQLNNGLTAGEVAESRIVLNFGDEETGIKATDCTDLTDKAGSWYSLDGVRLSGKPTKKGLYIHGGRKVLVRDKR